MSDAIIAIAGLEKSYTPGVPVLEDFDFELRRGEVHALIGSNGAGKSTLARILTGLTPRNGGEILLRGRPYAPANKRDAAGAGVIMVLQELNIIPTLSVAENLFIHDLPSRWGVVDRAQLRSAAVDALRSVGLEHMDPALPAGRLGVGQQQLVEIAAALSQESSVLILDEPTAALTAPEIDRLFDHVGRLRDKGVAIIYISHRMGEIQQVADRVTVMRDGRRIATHEIGAVAMQQLVREMAGSEIASRQSPAARSDRQGVGLRVRGLHAGKAVRGIDFEAYRGEILGVAGLIGSGRTETLRALFGADPKDGGDVLLGSEGRPLCVRKPSDAVAAGMALIPEDRKRDGLLFGRSITVNTTLASASRYARGGVLLRGVETTAARVACDRLAVKRHSLEEAVEALSGGNQQKVVVARWLLTEADILFFDEPTRGIDVAAKETIYELLDELAARGKTLIVVSSDLGELMQISHRIVVMSRGRIAGTFSPDKWSQESITAAAFAGYGQEEAAAV
jgi:ribose transport system ATP-binding protein